jgi:hypothetical protein
MLQYVTLRRPAHAPGNAQTQISGGMNKPTPQPDGRMVPEPSFDVHYAGEAVAYMANLPLSVNIFQQVSLDGEEESVAVVPRNEDVPPPDVSILMLR